MKAKDETNKEGEAVVAGSVCIEKTPEKQTPAARPPEGSAVHKETEAKRKRGRPPKPKGVGDNGLDDGSSNKKQSGGRVKNERETGQSDGQDEERKERQNEERGRWSENAGLNAAAKEQGKQRIKACDEEPDESKDANGVMEPGAVARARKHRRRRTVATSDEVLRELSDIALGRKEYPEYTSKGEEYGAFPAMTARLKALELLCKHHLLFCETQSVEEGPFLVEIHVRDGVEDMLLERK